MVATLLLRSHYWIGVWPETGGAVNPPAYIGGLIWAGASAWVSARLDSKGLRSLASDCSAKSHLLLELARIGSHLIWVNAGYLFVILIALSMTASAGSPGFSFFSAYATIGAIGLSLASLWGWLFGRILAPIFAAPMAVTSWLIVSSFLQQSNNNFLPVSAQANWLVNPVTIVLRLIVVIALCVVISWLPARVARFSFPARITPVVLGVAVAVLVLNSTTLLMPRPSPAAPICYSGKIQYCLWPENQAYIPLVQSVDVNLPDLPGDFTIPGRMVDYGMSGQATYKDGVIYSNVGDFDPELLIQPGSRWSVADSISRAIIGRTFRTCTVIGENADQLALQAWLEARLAGGGIPDYRDSGIPSEVKTAFDAGRLAASLNEDDQVSWAAAHVARAKANCSD